MANHTQNTASRRMPRPVVLAFTMLSVAAALTPAASSNFPEDEVHDVLWCVDETSKLVMEELREALGAVGEVVADNYRWIKCKLHSHPPIEIKGDVDVLTKEAFGISSGRGTANDPYVIQNWEIAGSALGIPHAGLAFEDGILIKDTDQHFVVKKNYVYGFTNGIRTRNAPNVEVRENLLNDNDKAIFTDLGGAAKTKIRWNDISDGTDIAYPHGTGIHVKGSSDVLVYGNTILTSGIGILVTHSVGVLVLANAIALPGDTDEDDPKAIGVRSWSSSGLHMNGNTITDVSINHGSTMGVVLTDMGLGSPTKFYNNHLTGINGRFPGPGVSFKESPHADLEVIGGTLRCADDCVLAALGFNEHVTVRDATIRCEGPLALPVGIRYGGGASVSQSNNVFSGCWRNVFFDDRL